MLEQLKESVCRANLSLPAYGLVLFTWGNVSGIDRESGHVVIKPSGVEYDVMTPDDMVVVDMNGNIIEGKLKPSSDLPTHLELYKAFPEIGGITHTHSKWATVFAQARHAIPAYGTTHADYFDGDIPCTRAMKRAEITGDYERNTGAVIVEAYKKIDYTAMPAVLVASHAPFTWGKDARESVHCSVILESVAEMAYHTSMLQANYFEIGLGTSMQTDLMRKHFDRKHGAGAYYGQGEGTGDEK